MTINKKSLIIFLSLCFLALAMAVPTLHPVAADPEQQLASPVAIRLNGTALQFSSPPVIIGGRTLVPIGDLSRALGATTSWNQGDQSINLTGSALNGDTFQVKLQLGSGQFTGDLPDASRSIIEPLLKAAPPLLREGRTFVPLRLVTSLIGVSVTWNPSAGTIDLLTRDDGQQGQINPGEGGVSLLLSEKDNGQQITVKSGQLFKLSLDSNPTTGYNWTIQNQPDASIVNLQDNYYLPTATAVPLVGSGGRQYWTFKGLAAGHTSIQLCYSRPWESKMPERTYKLDIDVR